MPARRRETERVTSPGAVRYGALSGMFAAVLVLAGAAVTDTAMPDPVTAGAEQWRSQELSIEIGVYVLGLPGLLLFLFFLATLVHLLPHGVAGVLTTLTGVAFFVLSAAADVFTSATASALGFHEELGGPEAVAGYLQSIGFHLGVYAQVAGGLMAVAGSLALGAAGLVSTRVARVGAGIGVVAFVAGNFGFGLGLVALWLLGTSAVLLRLPRLPVPATSRPAG